MTRGEKRKTGDAATCSIFDNFSSKFLFKSVGRQLATFVRILDVTFFSTRHGNQNGRSLER